MDWIRIREQGAALGLTDFLRWRTSSPSSPVASGALQRTDPSPRALRGQYDPDRLPEWFSRRNADWSDVDDAAKVADTIRKCTVVFACATYLADAVAESPLEVYRTQGGDREIATDRIGTVCRELLEYPNPHMSGAEFQTLLVLTMAISGYGIVEKVRGPLDLPVELWPLRPDWLQRQTRASGERYWVYRGSYADKREIPDADIVIVPYYLDPLRQRYGISPAMVAAREIAIDTSLTDFLKIFLDAGGIPPFVLTHPDPIWDDAQVAKMQTQWQQKYGGAKAYGALPILHGGYDLKQIGGDMDNMAWPDLRGLTEQKIAQAHRVPLELIQGQMAMKSGGLETTRMDGAMTMLQRYGAAPLRARIDGAFTRAVLSEFTGGDRTYDLAFDTSGILALQEDEDAKHLRVRADYDAGIITLNEARRGIGEDELQTGDVVKVGFSTILTPVDALIVPDVPSIPAIPAKTRSSPDRRYRNEAILTRSELAVRASVRTRTAKDRRKLIEIGTRALRTFFLAQGERIVGLIDGKSALDIETRVVAEIDWDEEEQKLREVLGRFYDLNGKTAFAATADLLGVSISWDLSNPNIQRVLHGLGRRIVAISEETRVRITTIIGDALKEGTSIPDLTKRLTTAFEDMSNVRAEVIARTETQVAYNRSSALSYQETGEVDEVELHDNSEHTTDPGSDGLTCAERDGMIVATGQAGRHIDAEHPNGTLAISPILRTALGEE
jgi:HK97 family phage portal protein